MSAPYQKHSETSRWAADAIAGEITSLRARVYREIAAYNFGLTDEQIQNALFMDPSTQRPRRIELVQRGFVEDSGYKRLTRKGRKAVVWVTT